jgi:hypothetical protein
MVGQRPDSLKGKSCADGADKNRIVVAVMLWMGNDKHTRRSNRNIVVNLPSIESF